MAGEDWKSIGGVQAMLDTTPLHRLLGMRIIEMDAVAGRLVIAAPATGNAARFDGAGQAHGGAVATLIDTCATFACSVAVGHGVPTMNLRIDYLRPASAEALIATATVRRSGRTIAVVDVEVMAGDKLAALGRCVQATGG